MKKTLLALALTVALSGCFDTATIATAVTYGDIPEGATDLMPAGNGWYSFNYKGKCYAMQQTMVAGFNGFDRAVIETDCPLTPKA